MPMQTVTVTVNAAFLQELKEDNEELRGLMAEFSALCVPRPYLRISRSRLASLLARLRDELAMHFSLEDVYGYFERPAAVTPQLSERACRLRAQHAKLYEDIGAHRRRCRRGLVPVETAVRGRRRGRPSQETDRAPLPRLLEPTAAARSEREPTDVGRRMLCRPGRGAGPPSRSRVGRKQPGRAVAQPSGRRAAIRLPQRQLRPAIAHPKTS